MGCLSSVNPEEHKNHHPVGKASSTVSTVCVYMCVCVSVCVYVQYVECVVCGMLLCNVSICVMWCVYVCVWWVMCIHVGCVCVMQYVCVVCGLVVRWEVAAGCLGAGS